MSSEEAAAVIVLTGIVIYLAVHVFPLLEF